jgi:2-alkyl-3-oxoalkanoate reductase
MAQISYNDTRNGFYAKAQTAQRNARTVRKMTLAGKIVFVTGATGFLGGALAQKLAEEGAQVRALARSPEKAGFIRDVPGIDIVQGDVTDADRMHALIPGCDYVFHAAAAFGNWDDQRRVNVEGTRHVMQVAAAAQVERVVHVSSIAVYGYHRAGHITEEQPVPATLREPYSATKAEAEAVVREVAAEHGSSYAIIRPGMIYGPRSEQWTFTMFRVARRRPVIWIGDGSGSTFPIHIDDVVDLMLVLATHPNAHNQTFNGVHHQPVTWREFLLHYARMAGHQRWFGIPPGLMSVLARIAAALAPATSQAKAAPEAIRGLQAQGVIDMSKARNLLGWEAQIDLPTGIQSCAPYLREKGLLR